MAGRTHRYPLMLIFVAVNAKQIMMFGGILFQIGVLNRMTAGTEPVRHKGVISHLERHVGLMTTDAVLINHFWDMRLMAFLTFQEFAMFPMTLLTIEQRMTTGIIFQLPALVRMTGSAGGIDPASLRKVNIHGMMNRMTS